MSTAHNTLDRVLFVPETLYFEGNIYEQHQARKLSVRLRPFEHAEVPKWSTAFFRPVCTPIDLVSHHAVTSRLTISVQAHHAPVPSMLVASLLVRMDILVVRRDWDNYHHSVPSLL